MENNPLVSVLMTAYNREKYIGEAIESVLTSSFTNFELIVLDDNSTDNSVSIAKEFELKDRRIKVYVNEKNLGQFSNQNRALKYAKGKYIKYFDSDDIMYENCLSTMVEAMEMYPQAFGGAGVGARIRKTSILFSPRQLFVSFFNVENLLSIISIIPSSVIFKREVFDYLGSFATDVGIFADTLFMMEARARFPWVG